ncbi:MAG TPA: PKD domain-containing protein, partial [Thermoanaerobaculia bacterium]|nr:PKD domain-containing protein [Thermoanaerobaculia bacterium]
MAKTEENAPGAVWVTVYDDSLQALTGDRKVASDARSIIALVWNGSEHGLFYTTANDAMFLQRLGAGGEPIGARVAITPLKTFYSGDEVDVVWSAALNAYAVAHIITQGGSKGLWITFLESSGAPRLDRQAPVAVAIDPSLDLAVTDTGVVGAFFNNSTGSLVFARATAAGGIEVRSMTAASDFIAAAGHDGMFVVTRSSQFSGGSKTEIRWFVVDTAQQIVKPDARLVAPAGDDVWPLALISNGDELALTYIEQLRRTQPVDRIYRLLRFEIDGTKISDVPFSAASIAFARAQSPHPIAWTGTSYVTAAVHAASDRLNSFLLRYCPLRAEVVSPLHNVRVNTPVLFSAVASGGVPDYQYSWTLPNEIGPKKTQNVEKVFDRTGTYTITLEVTDYAGSTTRQTFTVNVIRP